MKLHQVNILIFSYQRRLKFFKTIFLAEKHHSRFVHGKRGGNHSMRGGHHLRGGPYHNQRALLRYPSPGNFPLIPSTFPLISASASNLTPTITHISPPSLIPGQFPNQQFPPHPVIGGPPPQQQQQSTQNPNTPPALHSLGPHHDAHLQHPNRPPHPYAIGGAAGRGGFRPQGGPMLGFRPPGNHVYSQVPHEYGTGPNQFNQFRPMFRPEMPPNSIGVSGQVRAGMRLQRPPLTTSYPAGQNGANPLRHPLGPQPPNVGPIPQNPSMPPQAQQTAAQQPASMTAQIPGLAPVRPSKVLINPNFKGGVDAAKKNFIKETQFISTISSHVTHLQSDEELLRQQEEFIKKNVQHIEKRRHERSPPPHHSAASRFSRSRSRSRDRSYSPINKRNPGGNNVNRGSGPYDRHDRNDRVGGGGGRASSRERDRPERGGGNFNRNNNRFRRGSRDRDGGAVGNYGKRRRSNTPNRGFASGSNNIGGRGRAGANQRNDRDRNDVSYKNITLQIQF